MTDARPTDEIAPMVPTMPQSRARADGGTVEHTPTRSSPTEDETLAPLVPDLS